MPYDANRKLYLEFDGFTTAQQNFETWVPYLNYPLCIPMEYTEKKTLLDTYTSVTYYHLPFLHVKLLTNSLASIERRKTFHDI